MARRNRLSQQDRAYLDGLLAAFDDLPDGAWQAACENAIEECGKFDNRDAYDVWLAWATGRKR